MNIGNIRIASHFLLFTCLLLPVNAISDEVFLKNGDRISGNVVRKTGEILVLNTSYAGEIGIRWADVSHLATERPVHVILDDETDLKGILSVIDGTEQHIDLNSDAELEPLSIQQIAAINPPESPQFRFSGQVNLGVEIDRGNTDEDDYHLDAETEFRWPDDRLTFSFDGDLEKSDGRTSKQEAELLGDYDHFLTEKWFSTSGILLEHDKFTDLDSRTTINTGIGYQVFENNRTNLSIEGSPGYLWENFDESEDNDYPVVIWRLQFDRYLLKAWKLQAFHKHRFTQSLENSSDYIFLSKTGLRIPLFENLQVSLQYNFDRDNAPADDAKKDDHETLITAGYKW